MELSVILPCRNEEQGLDFCIKEIKKVIKENNIDAEIIVSDSSIDKSPEIAKKNNVVLVKHDQVGYGRAYIEGFKRAKGKYIFMADADGSYEFKDIPIFLHYLKNGYDLVIGDRFKGEMNKQAMPWHHKYIGNPILSGITRFLFNTPIKDIHCGARAIKRGSLEKLHLNTPGMEFATEMMVKASKQHLKIKELPINYRIRKGKSKLNSFSDGWRHLKYMLLFSPMFLFFVPGLFLFLVGLSTLGWLYFGSPEFLGIKLYYHPMFISTALIVLGYQLMILTAFAKIYAYTHLGERSKSLEKLFKHITIERASLAGLLIVAISLLIYIYILSGWINSGFSSLNHIKNSIVAITMFIIGTQTIFSSFMLKILSLKE